MSWKQVSKREKIQMISLGSPRGGTVSPSQILGPSLLLLGNVHGSENSDKRSSVARNENAQQEQENAQQEQKTPQSHPLYVQEVRWRQLTAPESCPSSQAWTTFPGVDVGYWRCHSWLLRKPLATSNRNTQLFSFARSKLKCVFFCDWKNVHSGSLLHGPGSVLQETREKRGEVMEWVWDLAQGTPSKTGGVTHSTAISQVGVGNISREREREGTQKGGSWFTI